MFLQPSSIKPAYCGRCLRHSEPVLLVGETGTGKTTVCQLLALLRSQHLHILNCNQHTEAADFLGGFRPTRGSRECAVAAFGAAAARALGGPLYAELGVAVPLLPGELGARTWTCTGGYCVCQEMDDRVNPCLCHSPMFCSDCFDQSKHRSLQSAYSMPLTPFPHAPLPPSIHASVSCCPVSSAIIHPVQKPKSQHLTPPSFTR